MFWPTTLQNIFLIKKKGLKKFVWKEKSQIKIVKNFANLSLMVVTSEVFIN
jgi:hypothetical protein